MASLSVSVVWYVWIGLSFFVRLGGNFPVKHMQKLVVGKRLYFIIMSHKEVIGEPYLMKVITKYFRLEECI